MTRLVVVEGPQRGASFDVQSGAAIGRSRTCAVRLQGRHISRVHARIEARGAGFVIIDDDSRNGVFVNGQKIKEHVLKKDDEIEIGEHILVFEPSFDIDVSPSAPPKAEAAADKKARGRPGTAILDSVVDPFAESTLENFKAVIQAARPTVAIEDEKEMGRALLDRLMGATGAKRGFVMLGDDRGRMKPLAKSISGDDAEFYVSNVVHHQVSRERRAIIAIDVVRGGSQAGKARSILCAPLLLGEQYTGFVYLDGPAEGTPPAACFSRAHLVFAAGVCAWAAPVLAGARRTARARQTMRAILKRLEAETPIIAGEGPMKEAVDRIDALAAADAPVLIVGELGTGKELTARALHLRGPRGAAAFTALHCAALPPATVSDALFGGEKGTGVVEATRGGTVYLAEVGALSDELQMKLAGLLEEQTAAARIEARILAGSSQPLDGKLRPELLSRFAATLQLPPLRTRKGDIPLLVAHFVRAIGGRDVELAQDCVSPDVLEFLERYSWPGNVGELRNAVERMLLAAGVKKVGSEHIPFDLTAGDLLARLRRVVKGEGTPKAMVGDLEKAVLEEALRRVGGNKASAADLLGLTQTALAQKIRAHRLVPDESTEATKPAK
ncbi:MAG: sigma 54-interacting transcriptional regulator [Planctomycetes bacterium]|nr:sigma 54-interacting transcriptional regulator [Planctomycetota bacterium]